MKGAVSQRAISSRGLRLATEGGWKVYGPDLNGQFGGLQGTGGLEATILDAGGTTQGAINDQFGNGVASVTGGAATWFATRVGAYGPLPGTQAATLTDITQLAAATAWRGRRIDPTGFYDLGARYYEPTSGRFLSADPMGQASSPSLYDFAGGDPVNYFDPAGRCPNDPNKFTNGLYKPTEVNGGLQYPDPGIGGQNPDDPQNQDNSAEIARYQAAVKKQLTDVLALLNATPGVDPSVIARVAETLKNVGDGVDLTTAIPAIKTFLQNSRIAGVGVAGVSNAIGVVGIVGSTIELANGVVEHDTGAVVSGSAGYVLGVGSLTASVNEIAILTQFNPYVAAASVATTVALVAYQDSKNSENAANVGNTIDTQLGYVNKNLNHIRALKQGGGG
jgi:RHS repeat-associated protein